MKNYKLVVEINSLKEQLERALDRIYALELLYENERTLSIVKRYEIGREMDIKVTEKIKRSFAFAVNSLEWQ